MRSSIHSRAASGNIARLASPFRSRTIASSAFAIVLALSSTAALAGAMAGPGEGGDEDDAPGKSEACRAVGCPNGNRLCGTATGSISSGAPPFVGEVKVSWTCYENGPEN